MPAVPFEVIVPLVLVVLVVFYIALQLFNKAQLLAPPSDICVNLSKSRLFIYMNRDGQRLEAAWPLEDGKSVVVEFVRAHPDCAKLIWPDGKDSLARYTIHYVTYDGVEKQYNINNLNGMTLELFRRICPDCGTILRTVANTPNGPQF